MKSGHWQVDIAEQDRHLTAFSIQAVNSGNGGSLLLVCVTRQVRSPY